MSTPPTYVEGHGLLAGKRVLVTAAAGTGIGFQAAKRAIEEGAQVVISDKHERRCGESAAELGVVGIPCDVTVEDDVQALVKGAAEALGGIDIFINNAGLGGEVPIVEMTDDQWNLPLYARRDEVPLRQWRRGHREQCIGSRLAGPRRPGSLRRSEGRRDGAYPLCRDRSGPTRRAH